MTIFLCRLVIIVSLGFGIVKPRLGPLLNRWSKENAFQENDSYFQGSRHRGSLLFACQRRGTYHTCRVHWFHNKNQREIFPFPIYVQILSHPRRAYVWSTQRTTPATKLCWRLSLLLLLTPQYAGNETIKRTQSQRKNKRRLLLLFPFITNSYKPGGFSLHWSRPRGPWG